MEEALKRKIKRDKLKTYYYAMEDEKGQITNMPLMVDEDDKYGIILFNSKHVGSFKSYMTGLSTPSLSVAKSIAAKVKQNKEAAAVGLYKLYKRRPKKNSEVYRL
jgi:hypothetical protein